MRTKTLLLQGYKPSRHYCFTIVTRLALLLILACSLLTVMSQSPTINDIRFEAYESPVGETLLASVELINTSGASIDLTGYYLTNEAASSIATLPSWILPDGDFLTIYFGIGTNDSDFSDDWGHYYTQGSQDVFDEEQDAVALYHPSIDPANIVDYVCWSTTETFTPSQANDNAQTAGIWDPSDFVHVAAFAINSTMGLSPDGFDNNVSQDWIEILWVTQIAGPGNPENPFLIAPPNGFVHIPNLVNFVWNNVPNALDFQLQIAADPDFMIILDDQNLINPFAFVNLPNGVYFWRVLVTDPNGVILNTNPEAWVVIIGPQNPGEGNSKLLAVPHYFQHKDTEMLCLTNDNGYPSPPLRRHGCNENAGNHGPWDGSHPANHATNCNHCNMYCIRASIQMINHFHKGAGANLSQDRLSYEALKNLHAGPEQDLGHNRGLLWATETPATYGWALGVGSTQDNTPTFNEMKAEIDAGRPVLVGNGHHCMVISGWRTVNGVNQIHLLDPWPTAPSGWMNWNVKGINKWYRVNGAINAKNQEANVTMDSDGDDVTDFCETVRGFCSAHDNPDTDGDGINDKKEIRSYTFHGLDHANGHVSIMGGFVSLNSAQFPDIDGDGSRAECDCDTDGDGDLDGNEDLNVNGKSPEANETCVYDFNEKKAELTLDKDWYTTEDNVLLSGESFRKNHNFSYEVIDECDPIEDGTPISPTGEVITDDAGKFENQDIGTYEAGWHQVIFDADGDGIYHSEGCKDLTICFEVKATGCCWNCDAMMTMCDGAIPEDECATGYTWTEGVECGSDECGSTGCTDSYACNYDSNAVCDDGSCGYYGCTDSAACNWDPTAYCDDESCYYYGCTDSYACNWDPYAGCDDDSCYYYGCMDYYACNYDSTAGCNDDSCYYGTCMDPEACNYDNIGMCEDNSQCHYYACNDPEACNYDSDAYCGSLDFCEYANCGGCMDSLACNYNSQASDDDGSCEYPGCMDITACNWDLYASCDDFSCTYPGCQDNMACNYDSLAGCDDGSCSYVGCTDSLACNYNANAGCEDGSCIYPGCLDIIACNYYSLAGCDDGSCTYPGCSDPIANNYNSHAGCDDGSCTYDLYGCSDPGACNYDSFATGMIGCTYPGCLNSLACNYNASAGCDDFNCYYPTCVDQFACNYDASGCYGGICTYPGCTDASANNYNSLAGCDDGSCTYDPSGCSDALACNYDSNATGENCIYPGCDDANACNYDPSAGCSNGTCLYYDLCGICGGTSADTGCMDPFSCNYNSNAQCDDGTCMYDCFGCTDSLATNYDPSAVIDDGTCAYTIGCTNPTACNYDFTAIYDDGSCLYDCYGCTDPSAINYDPSAVIDDGTCTFTSGCTNPTACNYDLTAIYDDGSCLYDCYGCTDPSAINYNPSATIDDGSCDWYVGCTNPTACNYDVAVIYDDGSCVYDCYGCTDSSAINYNPSATIDDGSCYWLVGCTNPSACNYYEEALYDDGSCTYGCLGCTDPYALNYNSGATVDDGNCTYYAGCTNPSACNYTSEASYDDGSCVYNCFGCTDPYAVNYNSSVTMSDGSCIYIVGCTYYGALNYDILAYEDDGSCVFDETCQGDLDGNMEVNTADLLFLLTTFGTTCFE